VDPRPAVVVLRPRLDVALARNRARAHKGFDTSILESVMHEIDSDLAAQAPRPGWHHLDNGHETVERTVDRILSIGQ
jgi:hypothetical protein